MEITRAGVYAEEKEARAGLVASLLYSSKRRNRKTQNLSLNQAGVKFVRDFLDFLNTEIIFLIFS